MSFTVLRPGTVFFTLTRLAPRCRSIGAFRVEGGSGQTRFLFPGAIDRRLLRPGTYELAAPGPRDRPLGTRIVVATRSASPDELRDALRRDACRGDPLGKRSDAGRVIAVRWAEGHRDYRSVIVVCLAFAIALFGTAALPVAATPGPRSAELLVSHRATIALGGGLAFGASLGLYIATQL